ncbi:hypothetical protein DsansV1_C05g0057691 [Dioscorea sansibarensis]
MDMHLSKAMSYCKMLNEFADCLYIGCLLNWSAEDSLWTLLKNLNAFDLHCISGSSANLIVRESLL